MRTAAQHIDVAIRRGRALHAGARWTRQVRFAEIPPAQQLRPVALEAVAVVAGADDGVGHSRGSSLARGLAGYAVRPCRVNTAPVLFTTVPGPYTARQHDGRGTPTAMDFHISAEQRQMLASVRELAQ